MDGLARSMRGLAVAGLTLLCGCVADLPPGQSFTYNGNAWRVSDDRAAGHLEIVAVDPRLGGLGTQAERRHRVDAMPPAEYRAAVMGWFATGGRFCTPDEGAPGLDPLGYGYNYRCWLPV